MSKPSRPKASRRVYAVINLRLPAGSQSNNKTRSGGYLTQPDYGFGGITMKFWSVFALAFALNGCTPSDPAPIIRERLEMVQGQPVSVLFSRLGYPTSEGKVAGMKFYSWSTSSASLVPSFATSNGLGMIGEQPINYNQTTYGVSGVDHLVCTLRIFVDKKNRIVNRDINGPQGACSNFATMLTR